MGLFGKAKRELGIADRKLLASGILARGDVLSCEPDGMTIGQDSNLAYGAEKVCRVVVEVIGLDGEEAYEATCKHSIPLIYIPKMQEKGAAVAVRVDPNDPQHIDGLPATGLVLTVHRDGVPDYQAQIGTHIPEAMVAKVVAGATLPARWVPGPGLPTDVNLVSPDWAAIAA
jgi:hypothetical protein